MSAADRREQILDRTLALVVREGYAGVSIEAVAREAGITRPVIYGAFGDLAGLLGALHDRSTALVLGQLADAEPRGTDPDRAVIDGYRAYLEAVAAAPDVWRLTLIDDDGTPAALRERTLRDRARVLARIEELVRWGLRVRAGMDDAAVERTDPELVALAMRTLSEESARLMLADPGRYPVPRLVGFAERALAAVPADPAGRPEPPPPPPAADAV